MTAILEPFYFGPGERLFGVYHPPLMDLRSMGVVLCHPMNQDQIRSHRALLKLALRLAERGFPVLRFDLSGCGDSHDPPSDEGLLARWQQDVDIAIEELAEGSGVETIALCGLRLGAALATLAAIEREEVRQLVLWDPVVRGAAHLAEIVEQHELWRSSSFTNPDRGTPGPEMEALGFPLGEALRAELRALDLSLIEHLPAPRIALVETREAAGLEALLSRLSELGATVEAHRLDEIAGWTKQLDETGDIAVPVRVLDTIVEQLEGWNP